jgi:hypothetical protein
MTTPEPHTRGFNSGSSGIRVGHFREIRQAKWVTAWW